MAGIDTESHNIVSVEAWFYVEDTDETAANKPAHVSRMQTSATSARTNPPAIADTATAALILGLTKWNGRELQRRREAEYDARSESLEASRILSDSVQPNIAQERYRRIFKPAWALVPT